LIIRGFLIMGVRSDTNNNFLILITSFTSYFISGGALAQTTKNKKAYVITT